MIATHIVTVTPLSKKFSRGRFVSRSKRNLERVAAKPTRAP